MTQQTNISGEESGSWAVIALNSGGRSDIYIRRKVEVNFKECVLVSLALLLLVTSLCLFYKGCSRNARQKVHSFCLLFSWYYYWKVEKTKVRFKVVKVTVAAKTSLTLHYIDFFVGYGYNNSEKSQM